jgi:hypothetical protein
MMASLYIIQYPQSYDDIVKQKIRLTDSTKSSSKQIVKKTEFSAVLNSVYNLTFISRNYTHANPCYDAKEEVFLTA